MTVQKDAKLNRAKFVCMYVCEIQGHIAAYAAKDKLEQGRPEV